MIGPERIPDGAGDGDGKGFAKLVWDVGSAVAISLILWQLAIENVESTLGRRRTGPTRAETAQMAQRRKKPRLF